MKVLSQPTPQTWKTVLTHQCGAKLEIETRDLTKVYDSRDGNYASATCPVCKQPITIASNLFPRAVWEYIDAD